jgi:hypothetical protein
MTDLDNEMSNFRNYVSLQEFKNDYLYQWQKYNAYETLTQTTQALKNSVKELKTAAGDAQGVSAISNPRPYETDKFFRSIYPAPLLLYSSRLRLRRYDTLLFACEVES